MIALARRLSNTRNSSKLWTTIPSPYRSSRFYTMTTANGTSIDSGQNGQHHEVSAWHTPGQGPSQFDFRSDTMTTPTISMLAAIQNTTLLDDVFLEDPTTNSLESHMAKLTGKEAALLVLSGTMGTILARARPLTQHTF